ncbi:MAG TPA: hypothetical protein VFK30_07555, partial [Anaerolineae bacterium]|nr:hypothetical protein [Anaerolineae bacterium]
CIVLIDGDEGLADGFRNKGGSAPIIMMMSPRIAIGVSTSVDDLGPSVNAIRAALVPAIMKDASLATILSPNGKITYDGLAGKLSQGSLMASDMELNFSIEYPLDINTLA